jgi:uncharacterized protein
MNCSWEKLQQLMVYRNILQDDLINALVRSESTESNARLQHDLVSKFITRAELLGLEGNIIKSYLIYLVAKDENIFSIIAEKTGGAIGASLYKIVIEDLTILKNILRNTLSSSPLNDILNNFYPTFKIAQPEFLELEACFLDATQTPDEILKKLITHYMRHGYGDMSNFAFFRWAGEEGLIGIKHPDPIQLNDILGYERQKETLMRNTEAFLTNKPCNNVLLVGARGTGKSSSVKAIANHYYLSGLRLVEVPKHELKHLSKIITRLRTLGKKFILFLDDLSFEEHESEYKYLKSVMEGGIESIPSNLLIYATSNRRHLIRETWNDRSENSDEVHRFDTVNEKISLSDRFGITLTYLSPNQDEYLRIIEEMAKKQNLTLSAQELQSQAVKWEMTHTGRSGRAAKQLVSHLAGSSK